MDVETDSGFMATQNRPQQNYAKFYLHPVLNKRLSKQEGRDVYEDKVYILILCPGNTRSEWRRPIQENDKRDYPQAWADFQAGKQEPGVTGTPVEYLGVSPARAAMLRSVHIHTVEQMAACPDTASKEVGMDFNTLKGRAQAIIGRTSPEMESLRARVAELEALLAKKKPGRKPKPPAYPVEQATT